MRVENEVMQAKAEKEKAIVVAEGQAQANKLLSDSIMEDQAEDDRGSGTGSCPWSAAAVTSSTCMAVPTVVKETTP